MFVRIVRVEKIKMSGGNRKNWRRRFILEGKGIVFSFLIVYFFVYDYFKFLIFKILKFIEVLRFFLFCWWLVMFGIRLFGFWILCNMDDEIYCLKCVVSFFYGFWCGY